MANKKTAQLRKKRTDLGLTLEEAAAKLGTTAGWLSRVERGHFDSMPLDLAFRLRDFYGIPVETWSERRTA